MKHVAGGLGLLIVVACSNSPSAPGRGGSGGKGGATTGSGGQTSGQGGDHRGAGGSSASGSGGSGPSSGGGANGAGGAGNGGASGSGGTPGSGGTSGSGGTPGDAAADVANETAPASCAPGALLCEDFEGYPAGGSLAPNWMTDTTGGTVAVDGTKPYRGTKAVHFRATASTSNLLQIWKKGAPLFPIKNNTFYGRVMMWLSRQPTGGVHFNTVQANGLLPGSTQIAKYAYGAMYEKLMAGYTIRPREDASPTVDCGKSPGTTGYPVGQWVCAEWKFDGANDEMHYWLNGVAQTAVDVIKTDASCVMAPPGNRWRAPVFDKVMLGWYSQPFAQPIDLWMDDIVISTEPIGCPKP
ncbi:MAG TPA: hypothetical protein VGG33_19485 [Polyangia bacterium]